MTRPDQRQSTTQNALESLPRLPCAIRATALLPSLRAKTPHNAAESHSLDAVGAAGLREGCSPRCMDERRPWKECECDRPLQCGSFFRLGLADHLRFPSRRTSTNADMLNVSHPLTFTSLNTWQHLAWQAGSTINLRRLITAMLSGIRRQTHHLVGE